MFILQCFDGNNIIPRPNWIEQNCSRKTQKKIYSVATIADQIMRGRRETEGGRVLRSLTDCVFCCVCIRKGLEGSQGSWNALNRMFFMWAHIGTVECWFSISDTCIRLHGKPTWLFFQSSIQGFLGGLFLFKNKCALNKDTLVTYIGNVNHNIQKEILFMGSEKTEMSHFFHVSQIISVYLFLFSNGA